MAVYDDIYRLGTAAALTVASAGGAAVSTSIFGTETYAIALSFPGSTSSTGGVRVKIVDPSSEDWSDQIYNEDDPIRGVRKGFSGPSRKSVGVWAQPRVDQFRR